MCVCVCVLGQTPLNKKRNKNKLIKTGTLLLQFIALELLNSYFFFIIHLSWIIFRDHTGALEIYFVFLQIFIKRLLTKTL